MISDGAKFDHSSQRVWEYVEDPSPKLGVLESHPTGRVHHELHEKFVT